MNVASNIRFSRPLTYSQDYPTPAFSVRPTVRNPANADRRLVPAGTQATFHAARARYGLAFIALACLKPGNTVLLPAYHCPAMVEPFLWAGCSVMFYPVTETLSPVADQLDEWMNAADAIVFTRYFGFEQVKEKLIERARSQRCLVIEDLAHAAFIPRLNGDVGVTSLPKFFPQPYGSEIWCADQALAEQLEHIVTTQQFSQVRWALSNVRRKVARKVARKLGIRVGRQSTYRYIDSTALQRPTALCTLRDTHNRPEAPEEQGHRAHYRQLLEMASRSALGVPLYPLLPPDIVPYVFPFLLHSGDTFHHIRNAGIPLYRWEELAPTDCKISSTYRSRLIQIPCHQDMKSDDFALIDRCLTDTRV